MTCPCCGNITPVKVIKEQANKSSGLSQQLIAIISETKNGKKYILPNDYIKTIICQTLPSCEKPIEAMERNSNGGDTFTWGITKWGDMFSCRQLYMLFTLIKNLSQLKSEINTSEYHQV